MIDGKLFVDNFAGGGGASTGIEMATGISVDIAINHDPEAIKMHKVNHPSAKHYCENVWAVDPVEACNGHPVALAWFSPDCKHFSKAKGGKPKDKNIRGLAWVACRWAGLVRPDVIMLENVEEFKTWGPLNRRHHPIKAKQGNTFKTFVSQLEELGYTVEHRELVAADYGAPTMRKRFFLVARCDGKPIVWPDPTHGPADSEAVKAGLLKPYVGAYTQLDFSLPCPSIFDTAEEIKDPLDTVTARDRFGLVTIAGVDYQIVDIGLRMLEPKELYGCQGFPDDYIIDHDYTGKTYPRSEQVRRCGNAVCPPIPAALVRANLPELCKCERTKNMKIESEQTGQLRFA